MYWRFDYKYVIKNPSDDGKPTMLQHMSMNPQIEFTKSKFVTQSHHESELQSNVVSRRSQVSWDRREVRYW